LLTGESGLRHVARLPSEEEVYLVFDTARWEGAASANRGSQRTAARVSALTLSFTGQGHRRPTQRSDKDGVRLSRARPAGLQCAEAKKFLLEYLTMDEARARELSAPQFEEATQALLCHRLDWSEIAALLRSPDPAERGTALLECLDHLTPPRRQALPAAAPWALELPPRNRKAVSVSRDLASARLSLKDVT
jgi:hypothetical protein